MKRIKCMLAATAMAICLCGTSITAMAYGSPFDFSITGTNKKDTFSVPKNDSEQNAYVTTSVTSGFAEGKDCFGFRVRRTSDGAAVTSYRTRKTAGTTVLSYNQGITGKPQVSYFMRGQIDSTSETKVIHITGVWLP